MVVPELPAMRSVVEGVVWWVGSASVAVAGEAGALLRGQINIHGMRSSGVGYLLLEIGRKIGCPSTGVSKRHPGTPYASEILEIGVARMIEIKLIGSISIPTSLRSPHLV